MTIEEVFKRVCDHPDDDEPRLEYADLIESADPDHATRIRLDLKYAARRRVGLDGDRNDEASRLSLIRRQERWAGQLVRFLPRHHYEDGIRADGLVFDRGFPVRVSIHPYIFLEYADLLFRLAPIRHIRFREPYDEEEMLSGGPIPLRADGTPTPFPLDEILAMPQLARLDSFGFDFMPRDHGIMPKDLWQRVAACPHLTRCKVLDTNRFSLAPWDYEALAVGALTSKMIRLEPYSAAKYAGESEVEDETVELGVHIRTEFAELGKRLEREHGYIPWLHESHNEGDLYDIAYLVEQGKLPKYPAGSPPNPEWYEFPIKRLKKSWW